MIRFGLSLLSVCWIAGVVVAGPALEVVQAQLPAPELEARGLLSLQGDVQRSLQYHIAARAAWLREDAAGALALWKQAAEADPANAAAWLGVARAATALEQTELAFAGWRFRHELVPNDLQAKGAIGESLAGTGNFELAAAFLLAGRAADVEDRVRWRREMRLFSLLHAMDQKAAAQEVGVAL